MSLTFHQGPNLSGRSAALKDAAWGADRQRGGTYLHPNSLANLSGLARTVAGESFLHDLHAEQRVQHDEDAMDLIRDLRSDQRLLTLSGGQQARLVLACALAKAPRTLAIDGLLEQLDSSTRANLGEILGCRRSVIALSDGYGAPFAERADETVLHARDSADASVNAALAGLARSIGPSIVRAPTIEMENVTFGYRGTAPVFCNASFRFEPSRPYLLKAPNGAGKSTLARILLGIERPLRGRITVDGIEHRAWRSARNLLFYAFQNPHDQLFGPSTLAYLERLGTSSAKRETFLQGGIDADPAQLLRDAQLGAFADMEPFELPWFVAKRISVLAALVSGSPWLFLDEPSIGSDDEGRTSLALLIQSLAAAGFGLIIVSHGEEFDSLPSVERITIRHGRIVPGGAHDGD